MKLHPVVGGVALVPPFSLAFLATFAPSLGGLQQRAPAAPGRGCRNKCPIGEGEQVGTRCLIAKTPMARHDHHVLWSAQARRIHQAGAAPVSPPRRNGQQRQNPTISMTRLARGSTKAVRKTKIAGWTEGVEQAPPAALSARAAKPADHAAMKHRTDDRRTSLAAGPAGVVTARTPARPAVAGTSNAQRAVEKRQQPARA